MAKKLYATGVPAAMESVLWQFSAIAMSRVILDYGTYHYAAYQLGLQAETITEMPADGFIIASTALTSRAIGEKSGALMRGYYRQLTRMGLMVGILASATLFLLGKEIMWLLTDKADLRAIGAGYVFFMGFAQNPQVLTKVYNGVIRAAGYIRVPMYFAFAGIWLLRVPLSMLACWIFRLPIEAIWIVIVADQTSRLFMSMAFARWKDIRYCVEKREQEGQSVLA
jgi:Na+-driven multidrug efflux pump